jgi:hypothetical protein
MAKVPVSLWCEARVRVRIDVRRKTVALKVELDEKLTNRLLVQLKRVRGEH